jgi:dihydrofolate reductase
MGRLIIEQWTSADGFAADAEGGVSFYVPDDPEGDREIERAQLAMLEQVDAIVLGANTYRAFVDYWPTAAADGEAVAEPINRLPKHVVSNTLERAPWGAGEALLERGDGAESVRALKERYSRDIIVWGSLTLADALFEAGLVDVLRIRVAPRLIGSGRGFTPDSLGMTDLRLRDVVSYPAGQVLLEYAVSPTRPS